MSGSLSYMDALHGPVTMEPMIAALISTPVVQRLRHVRLSNIDSVAMPGIANISRYEHVLGVAHLANEVGFRRGLNELERIALSAAALLHDWAITAFGHLVEEGFQYAGVNFNHEDKLHSIMSGHAGAENTGGTELQILAGRPTKLADWAQQAAPANPEGLLEAIQELIRGKGAMGAVISGTMDLDNIDNIFRVALHMGLEVDRGRARRLARAMLAIADDAIVFDASAGDDIQAWVDARREVYGHLMPAQPDFSLKAMIVAATAAAVEANEIAPGDWKLTDHDFLCRLASSQQEEVTEILDRWTTGEAWRSTPLWWLPGTKPDHQTLRTFGDELTDATGRHCFVYAIKDKRQRRLTFRLDDGTQTTFGEDPKEWLLGVASAKREPFRTRDIEKIYSIVSERFGASGPAKYARAAPEDAREPALL